jgi:2-amino-4-hydroxy-6-hydroxymethyldihydropteridine diphosphokinase
LVSPSSAAAQTSRLPPPIAGSLMAAVYVAAGSNVEPERNLALATQQLRREFPDVRFSPWYRNHAVGFEGADFINFAAAFSTSLPIKDVLARLYAIEVACGRPRDAPRWAPRSMDLDVLLFGELICDEPKLKLPRPDLLKRAFMLGPLAALAPELMHPTEKVTIGTLWERFDRGAHELVEIEPTTIPHSDRHPLPGSAP